MYTRVCIHMSIGCVHMPSYLRSHVYHMHIHLSLHVHPYIYPYLGVCQYFMSIHMYLYIYPYLGICQYFMSTTLLVAGNSKTGGWHLAQLAIEEARAKEHKRQSGQMRKCERNLIGNRGSANEPPHH
jgi:hypothetical protein